MKIIFVFFYIQNLVFWKDGVIIAYGRCPFCFEIAEGRVLK